MIRRLPLFLLALALAACAKPESPAQPSVQDADPALWVVKDHDTTLYLFGTIHLLKPGLSWFDEGVRDAFDKSGELVLELVTPREPEMQALVEELAVPTDGVSLPDRIGPAETAKLRAALQKLGVAPDALDRTEPWYAAINLSVLPVRKAGYDIDLGAESVLTREAQRRGKTVTGLETAREQLGYFDALSPRAQLAMLDEAIDGAPTAAATLEKAIAAWGKGDPDALAALVNDDLKGSTELVERLVSGRNRQWAQWIAQRMQAPGTVFVAVGAGHLAGSESVQAELGKRGIAVERVKY